MPRKRAPLQKNTLTYLLVCLGIALVLGVMTHFYRKYRTRGNLACLMNAARHIQELEAQHNTTSLYRNNHSPTREQQNLYPRQSTQPQGSTTRTHPYQQLCGHQRRNNCEQSKRLSREWGEVPRSSTSGIQDASARHLDSLSIIH